MILTDERRTMEDRRYAVLSSQTVKMFAESVGLADLSDDVVDLLSEDVTYRLRELVQHSCQFLRHCRRKKLTADDINKALRNSDTPVIHGYGTQEVLPFRQTKEGDIYFVEDLDINLPNVACSNQVFPQVTPVNLNAQWLAVEGVQKSGTLSQGLQAKLSTKSFSGISEDLLLYYDNVTKAILGNDEELMKLALVDLRTNSKIAPLMPYFTNFFANGVRTVNYDVGQLTKLLHTVRSLISNQSLSLQPMPYLDLVVHGVLYCVIEPLAASINPLNDHWRLRDYASRLLAQITRQWGTPLNNLRNQNITALRDVLHDLTRPFCSHYGAVMGLLAFGTQTTEEVVLPRLSHFCSHIEDCMVDNSYANIPVKADGHKVLGALLLAAEYVLKAKVKDLLSLLSDVSNGQVAPPAPPQSQPTPQSTLFTLQPNQSAASTECQVEPATGGATEPTVRVLNTSEHQGSGLTVKESGNPHKKLTDLYQCLYGYFGDALSMRNPIRHVPGVYVVRDKEIKVSLADADEDVHKSGEELLKQFSVGVEDMLQNSEMPDLEEVEPRSNQSPDDMDYDLEEKSERSERSSRSSRSHSDENLSFLGEDSDLTVKTVSDPSQGIKLTIMKLPKVKVSHDVEDAGDRYEQAPHQHMDDDVEDEEDDEPMPELEVKPKPLAMETCYKVSKLRDIHEVFDIVPMIQNDVLFVFRFLGFHKVYRSKRNSKRMQESDQVTLSEGTHFTGYTPIHRKQTAATPRQKNRKLYFNSGNIDIIL